MSSIEQLHRYAFRSELMADDDAAELKLCASSEAENAAFFIGELLDAYESAQCLRQLAVLVGSRFFTPPAMLAKILRESDPVITVSTKMLRFEGFSACCGVYGRLDILPSGIRSEKMVPGTTNVDFNSDMRNLLARFRGDGKLSISVRPDEFQALSDSASVFEKKVKLPLRWIKGFAQVQAIQSEMSHIFDLSKNEMIRFLRHLPKGKSKHPVWIVKAGTSVRISHRQQKSAVCVRGLERLNLLSELMNLATGISVFHNVQNTVSAWVVKFKQARFTFVFSEDIWRGFSGEGKLLESLVQQNQSLAYVRSLLRWQDDLSVSDVYSNSQYSVDEIQTALSQLAASGLVGYDIAENSYFHRELPFDLDKLATLNPRLKSALSIVKNNKVKVISSSAEVVVAQVASVDVVHKVELCKESEKCSCPWYAKHQNSRGICKHILAVKIKMESHG